MIHVLAEAVENLKIVAKNKCKDVQCPAFEKIRSESIW